jgi:CRP-like cAMP-binding protein
MRLTGKEAIVVKQGRVKPARGCAEGYEVILDILGPGEIFGELAGLKPSGVLRTSYRSIRITDFPGLMRELFPDAELQPEDLMTFPATGGPEVSAESSGKG